MQSSKRQKTLLHFFAAPVKEQPQHTLSTGSTNKPSVLVHSAVTATQSVPAQSNCQPHADRQLAVSSTDHTQKCSYDLPALCEPGPASSVVCLQQQKASSSQSVALQPGNIESPPAQALCANPNGSTLDISAISASSDDTAEAIPTTSMQHAEVHTAAPTANQYEQQVQIQCMASLHRMG